MTWEELMEMYSSFDQENPRTGKERQFYTFKCHLDHSMGTTNLFISGYKRAKEFGNLIGVKPERHS